MFRSQWSNTYIEVGRKCSEDDGGSLLVGKEKKLGFAGVVGLESLKVVLGDVNHAVSNEFVGHLLQLVGVNGVLHIAVVLHGDGVRRVHLVAGELGDALLVANSREFNAVDGSNSQHLLVLQSKLLILTLISL